MMGEVLIKNIEMPMHCAMCGFHGAMDDPMISQHFCKVTGVTILNPYKGRLDNCPLVPVPSHGRLGDLDELYAHLNEWYLTHNSAFTKEEALYIRAMLLGIVEAPTIIPAEPPKEEK